MKGHDLSRRYEGAGCLPLLGGAALVTLLAALLWVAASRPVAAQADHCDPGLGRSPEHPAGYRLRGDRCEGIYIQEVGSAALSLVSLSRFVADYEPSPEGTLILEWNAPADGDVRLRAQSLDPDVYYRMDAGRSPGSSSYRWPTEVLAALNLSRQKLGLLAWTRSTALGRDLYLPLTVHQGQGGATSSGYLFGFLPGQTLGRVFVTLAAVKPDGALGPFLKDEEELAGVFLARRPFTVPISEPPASGVYYLEVGVTLRGGGTTSTDVYFSHLTKR